MTAAPVLDVDRLLWEAGQVRPWRITQALDLRRYEGPWVDVECLAEEPAVDEWETAERYPTWEQLVALADLTDFPVAFFLNDAEPPLITAPTFICGDGCHVIPPPAVVHLTYGVEVVRATVGDT